MLITAKLPYLTSEMPGLCQLFEKPEDRSGYYIKQRPEDFRVAELPITPASGEGEHLLLHIQKTRQTTQDVIRRLAKHFHVKRHDIGYAGLKDKNAITSQYFSIYLPTPKEKRDEDEKRLASLKDAPFTILSAERHTQKLRRGHHRGNRFEILIRETRHDDVQKVKPILDQIEREGLPNFFGEQRFGYRQNNHHLGAALLKREWKHMLDLTLGMPQPDEHERARLGHEAYEAGDFLRALDHWPKHLRHERQALDALRQGKTHEQAVLAMDIRQRDFVISSFQSHLFNLALSERMRLGNWSTLIPGDLAMKRDNRAVFKVDADTAAKENHPEDGRIPTGEIAPSGPMWGPDMMPGELAAADIENAIFQESGVTLEDFEALKRDKVASIEGSRRPLNVRVTDIDLGAGEDEHGPYLKVAFNLPRGSFATIVLREIMKPIDGRLEEFWGKGALVE